MLPVVQYMENLNLPYKDQGVNHPVSLYAATKKSNELMAHSIAIFMGFQQLVYAFLLFMDQGDQIWLQ